MQDFARQNHAPDQAAARAAIGVACAANPDAAGAHASGRGTVGHESPHPDLQRLKAGGHDEEVRIVVVDDDQDLVDALVDLLSGLGRTPFGFSSPFEAQAFLESNDCEVLLSDVEMPGMSGIDLARWVSGHNPEIRVLIMSGKQIGRNELMHGWQFMRKPVDLAAVQRAIGG